MRIYIVNETTIMSKCLRKYQFKRRNLMGVSLKFISDFMDKINEVVFDDRDKSQSGKK